MYSIALLILLAPAPFLHRDGISPGEYRVITPVRIGAETVHFVEYITLYKRGRLSKKNTNKYLTSGTWEYKNKVLTYKINDITHLLHRVDKTTWKGEVILHYNNGKQSLKQYWIKVK